WLMMSLWDALRMNMMISYQELVRTFPKYVRVKVICALNDNLKPLMEKIWQERLDNIYPGGGY
ncbi:hypothetical protein V6078_23140, partial [Klebsiella pneumoniae]